MIRTVRWMMVAGAGALGVMGASPLAARRASASPVFHLHLVKSEPAKDDTLAAPPATIKLWFSQKPEVPVTSVKLAAVGGKAVLVGAPKADSANKALVVAEVKGPLGAGRYAVSWKTSSPDGHVMKGEIPFVVRAGGQ
jgi:copper resistance protein C